jgi:cold shock protein
MKPSDRTLTCAKCGIRFAYTAYEQRVHARSNPPGSPPMLCPGCRALERLGAQKTGTVRWYDRRKGYGFVRSQDGRDIFFHRSALVNTRAGPPRRNSRVRFLLATTDRGMEATEVCVESDANGSSEAQQS